MPGIISAVREPSKPLIVPVFIPHAGCPHRCIFCDQTRTTGQADPLPGPAAIAAAIERFLSYSRPGREWTEIAFYGGNFLGLPPASIRCLLESAAAFVQGGTARGIRFSTRPDTVDDARLALIKDFPVTTVELGLQSMNDQVLALCRRGHTADCSRRAVVALRRHSFTLGLQMMIGLPGQSPADALETGREIADLQPDFVRIYPLLVLDGSPLARWYREDRYAPLALSAAVELTRDLYRHFNARGIRVIRMGLQPTAELNPAAGVLAGPFHPAFGELVLASVWLAALDRCMHTAALQGESVDIAVADRNLSKLKGQRNSNLKTLQERYGLRQISARAQANLDPHTALVNGKPCRIDGIDS
jgi:histone acetyltransferase (RNA polymerase elongator complex component)